MPLTRYQIRNEYSLADPELYGAADKDDPEALLEGVAMAGLVGVLRQLGDLAQFAAEIFHDLHEEVMATAARGHGLMVRVQQLEAEFPSVEKAFLSQTSHSLFFYNSGIDWHPNLRMDQNLITGKDLPRFVMDSCEECRGPPRLFLLDKFDVAGAGACLKRYTDPSFFKVGASSTGIKTAEVQREKKIRKPKKKGSRWRNGETPDVYPTPHAKLQQLFLEECVESGTTDPARLVKLKRRLNGFPFDSRNGKSYMEKFLKTPSPEHKVVHEISVSSPPLKLPPITTSESGLEILEISTVSPDKKSLPRKRSPCSSPEIEETLLKPSMDELNEEVIDGYSKVPIVSPNSESNNIVSTIYDGMNEKETVVNGESKMEGSRDGYQSDDITSEIDNYMDALASMESEMETDVEYKAKNDLRFLNIEKQVTDSDENEEQQDLQTHFSDSQSLGNSTASDDMNSLSKKEMSNFSFIDSLRNLAENTPSDGNVSAKFVPSTESCEAEIIDKHSVKEDNPTTQPIENAVPNGICIEVAEIPSYRSEFAEPPSGSCLADVAHSLSPVVQEASLIDAALVGPGLDEISSNCNKLVTGIMNTEEYESNLGNNLPSTSNLSDVPSHTGSDFLAVVLAESRPVVKLDDEDPDVFSDTSLHFSNILEQSPRKRSNENSVDSVLQTENAEDICTKNLIANQSDSSHSIILLSDTLPLDLALTEQEICDPDLKPDGIVSEADTCNPPAGEIAVKLNPVLDSPRTSDTTEQQFSEITDDVLPLGLDSAAVRVSYSGEKSLDGAFNTADGEEIIELNPQIDLVGKDSAPLEFPSDFPNSPNPALDTEVHEHLDDIVTKTAQSEDVAVASAAFGTDIDVDNENDVSSLSTKLIKLHEESLSSPGDSDQNKLESMSVLPEQLKQLDTEKEVDQQAVASPKLASSLCNTISSAHSYSELVNDVPDSSMAVEAKNGLFLPDPIIVPPPSAHSGQDSESKCPQKSDLVENTEDVASSQTHCSAEIKNISEQKVELQADQFDVESHDAGGVSPEPLLHDVLESSIAAAAENCLYLSNVTSVPPEQKVELQADQFFGESHHAGKVSSESLPNDVPDSSMAGEAESSLYLRDATTVPSSSDQSGQDSESKSPPKSNLVDNSEDSASSLTHCLTEMTPSVQKVEFQSDQVDEKHHHSREISSELLFQMEQIKHPNYMDPERKFNDSFESRSASPPSQTLVSEFLPQSGSHKVDVSEQVRDPLSSIFPDFGLIPEVNPIDLEELPPLPPLPPMQWRMGKTQHGSLASERDLVQHNMNSFPPILPFTPDEKAQLGYPVKGGSTQPSKSILPLSAVKDDNSHNATSNMLNSGLFSFQVSTMIDHENNQDDFLTSRRTESTNPFLTLPTMYNERPQNGSVASEGGSVQPSLDPFSTETNTEDAPSTYAPLSLQEKLIQPFHQLAPDTCSEDKKLQSSCVISEVKEERPSDTIVPLPTMEDEQLAQHTSLTSEGESAWSSSASALLPPNEDGTPNGNQQTKLPRPRNPLIDAVAAHGKSKLRKVTERVRPRIGQQVDERDSLLEQIRTKSFNLKPTVMTRPSIQGPKTNLRVAAILEKANAIRQAFAGSDEDEDEDSWK